MKRCLINWVLLLMAALLVHLEMQDTGLLNTSITTTYSQFRAKVVIWQLVAYFSALLILVNMICEFAQLEAVI